MKFLKLRVIVSGLALGAAMSASVASAHIPLTNGSLAQVQGDSKVYFIQSGQKRWITTEQAFLANYFRWSDIVIVDAPDLTVYPEGAQITGGENLGQNYDGALLPDAAPVAPYDIRFSVENGRTLLRFTSTFWNRGKGILELDAKGQTTGDREYNAVQKIVLANGGSIERPVGTLFWHEVHQHYHYNQFGSYSLEMVQPAAGGTMIQPVITNKSTFCLRDDMLVKAPSEGRPGVKTYMGCASGRQGVSVGWADVYPSTLPDQNFDVTGLPAGLYKIVFRVDPYATFAELRRDNNVSMTFVQLDPAARTLTVVATASPYESPSNRMPDNALIQAEGDTNVYIVYHNKKRLVRNDAVLASYGMSRANALVIPKRAFDMIPWEIAIRVNGAPEIYALNVAGFKRRILSPDILASYGWTTANATGINQTEFNSMPFTDLIARIGEDRVYSMTEKGPLGTFASLKAQGLDSDSVHGLNEKDFQSFAVKVVADGLMIPWDVAILPDGNMLVTERTGTLRVISRTGSTVIQVPGVMKGGEGGLMGIALDPAYQSNGFVYLYYTNDDGGVKKNRVTRFRIDGNTLVDAQTILDNIPSAIYHDGGQIDFGPDGKLYVATGDATQPDLAQDKNSLAGKILRINSDGSIPSDNPFGNAVWTYGHRNPQGFAWDPNGRMYAAEHGPTGEIGLCCRDEVNRIQKGLNYGWPVITGSQVRAGMVTPLITSGATATWAPSGIAFANGQLFFAGLRGSALFQATIDDAGSLINLRSKLNDVYGRLRGAVLGPDGFLYLTTSNRDGRGTPKPGDDKILRIHPDFLR